MKRGEKKNKREKMVKTEKKYKKGWEKYGFYKKSHKKQRYNLNSVSSHNNSASNPCRSKHIDANRTKPEY